MLDERLEGANRQARNRWLKAAAVLAIGMSGFGLWFAEMFMNHEPSGRVDPPAPEVSSNTSEIQGLGIIPEADPTIIADLGLPIDIDPRERFKETLGEYLREVEPLIHSQAFARWDAVAQHDMVAMKEAALRAFSEGNHADALFRLEVLLEKARDALRQRETAFTTALSAAAASLGQDNYDDAILQITEALRIRPESPDALRLHAKIEKLPGVLVHLEAARIARLENNPQAELQSLEEVIKRDPARSALRNRMTRLRATIQDDRYSRHIARGLAALEKSDLDNAQKQLSQARQLFPNRTETALLARQALELDQALQVERLLQTASSAAQADDWPSALDAYRQVEGIRPGNAPAIQGRQAAERILALLSAVKAHLGAPHRLSSPNVASQAREVIVQSMEAGSASPELAARASELQQMLENYSRQVPVRIVSDGKTKISVRGVGRVGAVVSKLIHLKPGAYRFEGSRSGYKSEIVQVRVSPDAFDVQVEIVCDEPI